MWSAPVVVRSAARGEHDRPGVFVEDQLVRLVVVPAREIEINALIVGRAITGLSAFV
jgi:hypothetical protein